MAFLRFLSGAFLRHVVKTGLNVAAGGLPVGDLVDQVWENYQKKGETEAAVRAEVQRLAQRREPGLVMGGGEGGFESHDRFGRQARRGDEGRDRGEIRARDDADAVREIRAIGADQIMPIAVKRADIDLAGQHRVEDAARCDQVAAYLAVERRTLRRAVGEKMVAQAMGARRPRRSSRLH